MTVTFGRDANLRWRPSLAPWRGQEILVCAVPGTPLPAGQPVTIPDELAYVAWSDFRRLALDPVFDGLPDADELTRQRDLALSFAPHVAESTPSLFPVPDA